MASKTNTETAERDATATGQGRKTLCKYNTPDGPCVLWLNHQGGHDAGQFSDEEMELLQDSVPTEEEIAQTAVAERDPLQVSFDERIAQNYKAFKDAGGDKPQWRKIVVRPAMSEMVQRKIRNAADFQTPPVGVRVDASFEAGGMVKIMYAAINRRKYNRSADK